MFSMERLSRRFWVECRIFWDQMAIFSSGWKQPEFRGRGLLFKRNTLYNVVMWVRILCNNKEPHKHWNWILSWSSSAYPNFSPFSLLMSEIEIFLKNWTREYLFESTLIIAHFGLWIVWRFCCGFRLKVFLLQLMQGTFDRPHVDVLKWKSEI